MTGYVPDGDELKKAMSISHHMKRCTIKISPCTHLSLDISVDEDVEKYKNKRTQYKPCDKCTKHEKVIFPVCISQKKENLITRILAVAG